MPKHVEVASERHDVTTTAKTSTEEENVCFVCKEKKTHDPAQCLETMIQKVEELQKKKKVFSVRETGQVKIKNKLIRLVGEKPLLKCALDGVSCTALWDTGSMVCLVSLSWFRSHFPDGKILDVSEFLEGDSLHLCAANNTDLEVEGVAVMEFGIEGVKVDVPFVVSKDDIAQPIIGFNVIRDLVVEGDETMSTLLVKSFQVRAKGVEAMVNFIRNQTEVIASDAKTTARTVIPPHTRCRLKCKTGFEVSEMEENVMFSPDLVLDSELEFQDSVSQLKIGRTPYIHVVVSNPTSVEHVIEKGVVVGSVETVSAVIPIHPKEEQEQETFVSSVGVKTETVEDEDLEDDVEDDAWMVDVDLSHLSDKRKKMVTDMLKEVSEVFQKSKNDHGEMPGLQMEIPLYDNVPVCVPHRHIARPYYDEVKNYINDLIVNNWIRESTSSYSSPIVCVRKKDQTLRLCIDYRALNKKMIPDKQPIPRIAEIMDNLCGMKYFSTLDMVKAYHQGYVKEEFRKFTAFSTPWGLYEWIRIPMGISNAPPAFQRYINKILIGLRDSVCVAYLDDILVYAKSFKDHVRNLKMVLLRLISKGVKLRADKCRFFQQEVRYLGRLLSKDGYRADPEDTKALEKFRSPPSNVGELRTLLGFFGYYRVYIKDFARKFKPLYDLLKKKDTDKVSSRKTPTKHQRNSKQTIDWTPECQEVVNNTIDFLKSPQFLVYPDYELPFSLHVDASETGLGAVLYQKQGGKDRVVSFASRTLSDPEKNYHLHSGKLEFLGLKWAVTEKFADYLCYGEPFTVFTDNNPLTYVTSTAKLNATGYRWVAELANFQFSIKYKPGKLNCDADGLSRQWTACDDVELKELEEKCTEEIKLQDITPVLSVHNVYHPPITVDISMLQLKDTDGKMMSKSDLAEVQEKDAIVGPVYTAIKTGVKPQRSLLPNRAKILMKQYPKLELKDGVLVRVLKDKRQIVLPNNLHHIVYTELHQKMGHLGSDRVVELSKQRFYWPYMSRYTRFRT